MTSNETQAEIVKLFEAEQEAIIGSVRPLAA